MLRMTVGAHENACVAQGLASRSFLALAMSCVRVGVASQVGCLFGVHFNCTPAAGQFGNNGFLFKLQNETCYNSRIFASSKFIDATKHPKLVITYSL